MISKKLLKSYECDDIYDYFNIVMESKINGNRQQAIDQFKKIDKKLRFDFLVHVQNVSEDYNLYDFFLRLATNNI